MTPNTTGLNQDPLHIIRPNNKAKTNNLCHRLSFKPINKVHYIIGHRLSSSKLRLSNQSGDKPISKSGRDVQ